MLLAPLVLLDAPHAVGKIIHPHTLQPRGSRTNPHDRQKRAQDYQRFYPEGSAGIYNANGRRNSANECVRGRIAVSAANTVRALKKSA